MPSIAGPTCRPRGRDRRGGGPPQPGTGPPVASDRLARLQRRPFGGGSNVVPPTLAHFGGRTDFDVRVFWTFMNLGAGNLSLNNAGRRSSTRPSPPRAHDQPGASRVTSARAEAWPRGSEIEITRSELASAESGFREDLERSRQNLGRPIEVLNSLNLLGAARVNVVRALLHYDQAQFRLFVALGSPPPLPRSIRRSPAAPSRDHSSSCTLAGSRSPACAGLRNQQHGGPRYA